MKKLMMALAFVGLGTVAANAQCDEFATPATSKYSVATNNFWSNWFVQAGVDMTVVSRYGYGNLLTVDWHDGRTYGFDFAVGKWFAPTIGTRLKLNWENGAFYHAFRNGDDLSGLAGDYNRGNLGNWRGKVWETADPHAGGYAQLYFDTEFNLSNIFCGYNESRVWNLIAFPRFGVIRNFATSSYAPSFGVGIESTWKISKRVNVYADVTTHWTTDDFIQYFNTDKQAAMRANNMVAADLGITYNIGKTGWSKAVSLDDYEALSAEACSKLAALRSQLKAEQDENARLRDLLARQPQGGKVEKVVTSNAISVFFDLNSAKMNSNKDLINLQSIAASAKAAGAKVVVTGSADSKTGSSAYNQKLSEARAQAVADKLVELGVSRANIETKGVGGVNDVEPFTLNRRALVTLK